MLFDSDETPLQHPGNTSLPQPQSRHLGRRAAGILARSPFLSRGKQLWQKNETNWNLQLSKWDKLWVGAYLILRDYSQGAFPPAFHDQQQAYLNETDYRSSIPGVTPEEITRNELTKPFWFGPSLRYYMGGFLKLAEALESANLTPPAKLLELGGGSGWTAEFLANLGFKVVSTTLSPHDVETALKRSEALHIKGIPGELHFLAAPMESVANYVKVHCPFDAVFVFEALHHAFDWQAAIRSSFSCLRPGGWLLICNEPNFLHTAISYRVAKLSNTHEIGFGRRELVNRLKQTGFQQVLSIGKKPHLLFRPHWLLAQK